MRRMVLGLVVAVACCLTAPAATAAEDAERFCTASPGLGGRFADFSAPDPREDPTYARRLAKAYEAVAKFARSEIATDARALAAYFRQLARAGSTKRAVKIANRRYDEVSARERRFADYVEDVCIESQLPPLTSPEGPYVEYAVGGEGRALIRYLDASGVAVEATVDLPWFIEVPAVPGQAVRVAAVQRGDDVLWCTIRSFTADDSVDIASDATSGDHVTVICEGTT